MKKFSEIVLIASKQFVGNEMLLFPLLVLNF